LRDEKIAKTMLAISGENRRRARKTWTLATLAGMMAPIP